MEICTLGDKKQFQRQNKCLARAGSQLKGLTHVEDAEVYLGACADSYHRVKNEICV